MSARGSKQSIARVTIEAATPFTIGTGGGDDVRDSICVTDANGLPTIPGSSIAGVLRHAHVELDKSDGKGPTQTDRLFGFQEGTTGTASRLHVSWAQIHDENDQPVPFRRAGSKPQFSEVLSTLEMGVTRDHVRIGARGAVDDRGKFDETLVPAGARFTFELVIDDPEAGEMDRLLGLLVSPALRLGGRARMGFGRFEVVRIFRKDFDLTKPAERNAWFELPRALEERAGWEPRLDDVKPPRAAELPGTRTVKVVLRPEDYWLVGGGEPLVEYAHAGKIPDMVPVSEERIVWAKAGGGRIGEFASVKSGVKLLPATAIKGALRHRVAFLARCNSGEWIEGVPESDLDTIDDRGVPEEVDRLFGEVKNRDEDEGTPGHVFVSDVYLADDAAKVGHLDHVSLDRFTSGPIDGALFGEAPLFATGGGLTFDIVVQTGRVRPGDVSLLDRALRDLVEGRLALGSGANRGHGYFRGKLEPDNWIGGTK